MSQPIIPSSATPFSAPALQAGGINGLGSLRFVGTTNGGAPTSGTYQTGDVVLDLSNLVVWVCQSGGTPGTWVGMSYLRTDANASNPQTVANQLNVNGAIGNFIKGPIRSNPGIGGAGSNRIWFEINDNSVPSGQSGNGPSIQFSEGSEPYWEIYTYVGNSGSYSPSNDQLRFYYDGSNPGDKFWIDGNGNAAFSGSVTVNPQAPGGSITLNPAPGNNQFSSSLWLNGRNSSGTVQGFYLQTDPNGTFTIANHSLQGKFWITQSGAITTGTGNVLDDGSGNMTVTGTIKAQGSYNVLEALSGGYKVQGGFLPVSSYTIAQLNTYTITFPTAFSSLNCVVISPDVTDPQHVSVSVQNPSSTSFQIVVYVSQNPDTFARLHWIAIGT